MLKEGTRIVAPDGSIGTIRACFEKDGSFAEGYLVKFDDGTKIFMPSSTVKEYMEEK